MRHYEMIFVTDPRLSDEEVVKMTEDYVGLLGEGGGEVVKEESWGKRRLAYPIQKLTEGRYVLLHVQTDGSGDPFPTVQQRMSQNDKILRYLTVRTEGPPESLGESGESGEAEAKEKEKEKEAEEES